jgi:hypothetical protein
MDAAPTCSSAAADLRLLGRELLLGEDTSGRELAQGLEVVSLARGVRPRPLLGDRLRLLLAAFVSQVGAIETAPILIGRPRP